MSIDVTEYIPLVHGVAKKMLRGLPKNVLYEDLVGFGLVGLCEAASRFREGVVGHEGRTAQFATYAYIRVRGAIIDGLCKMAGTSSAQRHLEKDDPRALPILAAYIDDIHALNDSDNRSVQAQIEDVIFIRQLLDSVSAEDRAFIDELFHADNDSDFAKQAGLSKSWVSRLRDRRIKKLQQIEAA